ncbi:Fc receptor-like protein 5 isoform X2 [Dama dama]|uniref:Fc receptor-like protein 5 isoform X2 n=1 Tax=Dama dama TaxID=30532 RepID=UPI002A35D1C9|nr:Fc receptor-like protein 5 isoform X2 [Dama dama]
MLLWVSLLILAPVGGQFATEVKSVISLHPPWTTLFQGETATLICKALQFNAAQKIKWYRWYLPGEIQTETAQNTYEVRESGGYKCQAQDAHSSDRVDLIFSAANLILQAPFDVFEEDSVVLRCQAKANIVLTNMTLYKNGKILETLNKTSDFHIHQASMKDNELFPSPVLRASSTQPTERDAVTLTCETQISQQRPEGQLLFRFVKQSNNVGSDWKNSPEFQFSPIRKENSGSYWCEAWRVNSHVQKRSQELQIQVREIVQVHYYPEFVFEGQELVLICSVNGATKPITVSWYKKQDRLQKDIELQTSSKTEFTIPVVQNSDAGEYYCIARNSRFSKQSNSVIISVKVPVSQPVLTLRRPGTWNLMTDKMSLQCEVQRGSLPIWYQFFHEGVLLEEIKSTSERKMFHRLSPTEKHSGNYYCTANNGLGPQWSKVMIPVSKPVLTFSSPGTRTLGGIQMSLQCEVQRGSLPIWYQFFREGVLLKKREAISWRTVSYSFSVTGENSGNYYCTADNGFGPQRSEAMRLSVTVPVSQPVLSLSPRGTRTLVGNEVRLQCEVQRGSLPIWFQFFWEDVLLTRTETTSWRTVSYSFSVTGENSGNYYCTADNGFGPQRSESINLSVIVPVSQPVLSLSPRGTRTLVGNEVRLQCEVQRGSLPIWFQFFWEDVLLTRTETTSWRTVSYSFSVTGENSGNYYCTADNGFGPQRSESINLSVIVPVSQPVFSLSPRGTRTLVGNEVRLQCEVQRGSLPIWFQFFWEDVLLTRTETTSWRTVSYSFSVTGENSGNYYCTADNGFGPQRSESINLSVIVPVSRPVLTLRAPRVQAVVGDVVELHCEAQRGSPPILYQFYHEDVTLGSSSSPFGGGASFNLILKAEHSGNYFCEANNGQGVQRSHMVPLSVRVPVSHPVLTLRTPRVQAVVGDVLEIHCESQRGSSPIQYQFYHEDVALGNSSSLSGGGTSFYLSLTTEHSGNYSCEADNGLGVQRSEAVSLNVRVPVSRPVLTLRTARTQVVVGDVLELHCEAQRGSSPILYWFYHNNVTLENSTSHSGQGVSLNLLLTADHSGTYSCKADNGLSPQHSEAVTLSVMGLTGSKSSLIATSVTGGLLSMMAIAAVAVLFYCWLLRKAGRKPTFDSSRNPSAPDPQESTYHNVPGWIELQPVYSNVNPNRGEVVYSEVWSVKKENKVTAASEPELFKNTDSCVIYSQVKGASTAASKPQFLDPFTPHR